MMAKAIVVQELGDGDYKVIRGGEIYRKWNGQAVPGTVAAGDNASAAAICEWQEYGVKVRSLDPRDFGGYSRAK